MTMMRPSSSQYKDMPLSIVGSTKFGRYPIISSEQTFNMIESDGWMVPFAGYRNVVQIDNGGQGRGIESSVKLNELFAVIDDDVYYFDETLHKTQIGTLATSVGDVYISENNAGQVAFSDNQNIYVYDSVSGDFTQAVIDFTPGYITFQNARFISPDRLSSAWRLSDLNNGLSWPNDAQHVGQLQTKPDNCVATLRFPGRGNLLFVFGKTVTEQWYDVGAQLFPYQRAESLNIDYGCINAASIAQSDTIVAWVGINEKSGAVIIYSTGGDFTKISNDGIDYRLANLTNPSDCFGFMFRQDGHLFYVITWKTDNVTYAYDFNTEKFYTLCDENMNAFIVKRVSYFNGNYYCVNSTDGNLYELSSQINYYDYGNGNIYEAPRIRIPPTIRRPDQARFVAGYIGFTIEQGTQNGIPGYVDSILVTNGGSGYSDATVSVSGGNGNYVSATAVISDGVITEIKVTDGGKGFTLTPDVIITSNSGSGATATASITPFPQRVDLSLSRDNASNYGSDIAYPLNPLGKRMNRLLWWQLGAANTLTPQFRFHGMGRFICTDGIVGIK